MDSGMISKIQKAKRYAEEPERVVFQSFGVTFKGEHSTYNVTYDKGEWSCECPFFHQRGVHSQLGRPYRCDITAGTTPDDNTIIVFHHLFPLSDVIRLPAR